MDLILKCLLGTMFVLALLCWMMNLAIKGYERDFKRASMRIKFHIARDIQEYQTIRGWLFLALLVVVTATVFYGLWLL